VRVMSHARASTPARMRLGLDPEACDRRRSFSTTLATEVGPPSRSVSSLTIEPSRSSALTNSRTSAALRFRSTVSLWQNDIGKIPFVKHSVGALSTQSVEQRITAPKELTYNF